MSQFAGRLFHWLCVVCCVMRGVADAPLLRAADPETASGPTYNLLEGNSLEGWTAENGCDVAVDYGVLLLKGGDGWVRSDHTYADFKLHLEWKALQKANYDAGIFIRTPREGKPFPEHGYQINLLQGKEGNIGNLPGATSTGLVKPVGEWNTFDITVVGETVTLDINGKRAYSVPGLKVAAGYIGFQVEVPLGGKFMIRKVQITELGAKSLFNGNDLTHWEGAGKPAEACWEVQEGLLTCTGKPGPWLKSKEEYGDFNLRLDYQVSDGGNSGVYVRVPADGKHHRQEETEPPAGFEVQILDDAAAQYRDLKDYQYSASVYDIAGAKPHLSKGPGRWNTLEINCLGQHVIVTHNGTVVVDADEEHFPLLKLRSTKGFLGLQNHSTLVKFRNVRIAPAMGARGGN